MVAVCPEACVMTLASEVHSRLDAVPGRVGFYARNLRTSECVEYNSDLVLPAESAAKVFVLLLYSHLATGGIIDSDRRVPVGSRDHALGTGVLRYLEPDLRPTVDDLAMLMIIVSDNTATRLVLREVGGVWRRRTRSSMAQLGARSTVVSVSPTFPTVASTAASRSGAVRRPRATLPRPSVGAVPGPTAADDFRFDSRSRHGLPRRASPRGQMHRLGVSRLAVRMSST